jgi:hypothetical protein
VTAQKQFRDNNSPNLSSFQIEGTLGTTTKINGSGEVATVVTSSKTQIKQKVLKVNTWVISQEVLFFNAFELGAENCNIKYCQEMKHKKLE